MLARVLAMALCLLVCPSVCLCLSVRLKLVFYRNGWTDWAAFWREGFFRPILHCVIKKFMYLEKYGYPS